MKALLTFGAFCEVCLFSFSWSIIKLLELKEVSLIYIQCTYVGLKTIWHNSGRSRERAVGACPPPQKKKMFGYECFLSHFVSECLKNKAQSAWESIKNLRASRALRQALDPGREGLWALRSCTYIGRYSQRVTNFSQWLSLEF